MEADYPHTSAVIGSEGEGEGEHNQQGEKKSVLKKVKDKAKKIKDTITKHGGHGHDHDEEEEDDDDDEDEETTVNASDVHGAPLYESGFISGTNLPKQTGLDLEKPAGPPEDPNLLTAYPPKTTSVHDDDFGGTGGVYDQSLKNEVYRSKNTGGWEEMYDSKTTRDEFPPEYRMPKVPDGNINMRDEAYTDEVSRSPGKGKFDTCPDPMDSKATVKIEPLGDLVEDPHCPKNRPEDIPISNYQTKAVDPTGQGGKEADVSPLVERLDNLHVGNDESGSKHTGGSHDQFAPTIPTSKNPESPKALEPESMPRDTIAGKISSVIADKAVSAKNAVASKLGYGEAAGSNNFDDKVGGGGGSVVVVESDEGKGYWAKKLSPGDEDRALSEAITDAIQKRKAAEDSSGTEGAGVVGRVKGAVSSWLGMSGSVEQDRPELQSGSDVHGGEGRGGCKDN